MSVSKKLSQNSIDLKLSELIVEGEFRSIFEDSKNITIDMFI